MNGCKAACPDGITVVCYNLHVAGLLHQLFLSEFLSYADCLLRPVCFAAWRKGRCLGPLQWLLVCTRMHNNVGALTVQPATLTKQG